MLSLELALRFAIIGQQFLIAVVLGFGNGSRAARLSGVLLLLGVSSYLLISSPSLREVTAAISPILLLLAMIVPYCLWLFARAVFEADWPQWWITVGFAFVAVIVWVVFIGADSYGSRWLEAADIAMHIAALTAVVHAIVMAATGRPDDLIERRRRFRTIFIVIVATQIGIVLAVELFLRGAEPGVLVLINVGVIEVLTVGLAIPLLLLNPEFFAPAHARRAPAHDVDELSPAEGVLKEALLSAMAEGAYRQTGLTISTLAGQLSVPEHQLRKLINGSLGFRNFSAFLNSYRIAQAREILSDRGQVRTPVLTIALDLGYGSLGPFNRAFKAATDATPTEYRQKNLRRADAETE